MRHPRTTVALATAGALGLAVVPVIAQEIADPPAAATATESEQAEPGVAPSAEPSDRDASEESVAPGRHRGPGHFGPMVDQLSDDFAEELADELGLEADEVADAIDRIRERWTEDFAATLEEHKAEIAERMGDRLDQAVEEEALTQEQADALADLFAGGQRPGPGMLDELTDEQREALDALREWAGEALGERGWGLGPGGHGPGDHAPGDWRGGSDDGDAPRDDSSDQDTPSDVPTVEESMLQTT
ncbi:hypothetical protein [Salsipaludibacter albus]|uniref:hypothetical protein n=1 Tax=Salsipaludibacter albus TaxID=2849650 RepID=UPI001EE3CB49|nr:hypothetical protein [Salsipaludibacter albus]MBY5161879.1 hypothetical protein [Salsipaludibacter albus]